jgi:hypothetical protein
MSKGQLYTDSRSTNHPRSRVNSLLIYELDVMNWSTCIILFYGHAFLTCTIRKHCQHSHRLRPPAGLMQDAPAVGRTKFRSTLAPTTWGSGVNTKGNNTNAGIAAASYMRSSRSHPARSQKIPALKLFYLLCYYEQEIPALLQHRTRDSSIPCFYCFQHSIVLFIMLLWTIYMITHMECWNKGASYWSFASPAGQAMADRNQI